MSVTPSIIEAIFGDGSNVRSARADGYREGLQRGFDIAKDHMEKALLREGQPELAKRVSKLRLKRK